MRSHVSRRCSHVVLVLVVACGPSAGDDDDGVNDTTSASPTTTDDGATPEESGSIDDGVADTSTASPTSTTSGATTDPATDGSSGADDTTGPAPDTPPTHLLVIRMPHGAFEEEIWSGSDEEFLLGPVLQPLEPWADALVLVDGVDNVIVPPEDGEVVSPYGVNSASILTGGRLGSWVGEDPYFYFFGGGPSLDVVLGDVLGARSLHANVHLGVYATDAGVPLGVSYVDVDQPFVPMDDPALAAATLFDGLADPLLDELQDELDLPIDSPGDVLDRQLAIAHAAIALDVTPVQLLSIDRGVPSIVWTDAGATEPYHDLVAGAQPFMIRDVQRYWAERIAVLLGRLEADGLLETTVIVWLSAEGSPPAAYPTEDVFAVIVDRSGTFATGRIVEVDADQADFAVTIAEAMSAPLPGFGHPDLDATVIDELLAR